MMEESNAQTTLKSWVPTLKYDGGPGSTRMWMQDLLQAAHIHCQDPLTILVLADALKIQPAVFKLTMPKKLAATGDDFDEEMASAQHLLELKDYSNKKNHLLPVAQTRAFNIVNFAVEKGSPSENVLENNRDWIENKDGSSRANGYMCAARSVKAILDTHVHKRRGASDDADREIEKRRLEANQSLHNIKFPANMSPDTFNKIFRKTVQNRKDEGCPDLTEAQLVIIYLQAVRGNKLFRTVASNLENGTWKYPANYFDIYIELNRFEVAENSIPPGYKPVEGGVRNGFVLISNLKPVPPKDRSETGKDENKKTNARQPGLQKNGATFLAPDVWKAMSKEQKDAHHESNKKAMNAMAEKKKVMLASSSPSSSSEFSDDDEEGDSSYVLDGNSPYCGTTTHKATAVNLARTNNKNAYYDEADDDDYNDEQVAQSRMLEFEKKVRKSGHCREVNNSQSAQEEEALMELIKRKAKLEAQLESDELIRKMRLEADERVRNIQLEADERTRKLLQLNYEKENEFERVMRDSAKAEIEMDLRIKAQQVSMMQQQQQQPKASNSSWTSLLSNWIWGTTTPPPATKSTSDGKGHTLNNWLYVSIAVVVTAVLAITLMSSSGHLPEEASKHQVSFPSFGGGVVAAAAAGKIVKPQQQLTEEKSVTSYGERDNTKVYTMSTRYKSRKPASFDPFCDDFICFDTGSEVHVAKSTEYASNIRSCRPGTIGGINSDDQNSLKYDQKCSIAHPQIKDAVVCRGATANIISPALARNQGFRKEYLNNEDVYKLTHESGGQTMTFGRVTLGRNGQKSNLYIMDMNTYTTPTTPFDQRSPSVNLTIAQNKSKYTKKEVSSAEKALRFLDCIGQPPLRAAIDILRATKNAPVTEKDLIRAQDIWGPRISYLKGITTKKTTAAARTDTLPAALVPVHVTMEVDVFFVKKRPFLISITLPLDYCMVKPLGNLGGRVAAVVATGILEMVDKSKSRNFVVGTISSDNEGGIAKQATAQQIYEHGIELSFVGAGQHCPHIERRIQFVKGKFRKHEHRLEYAMNNVLVDWGVIASVRETNMQRSSSSMSELSPREKFLGRPYDWKRDGRAPFGTYAQMTVRDTDNTAAARTEGCILLCPKDNLTGTMWALNIHTQRIVSRDHFYEVPLSDALISHLNDLAAEDGLSRGSDAFHESEYGVVSEDNDEKEHTAAAATSSIVSPDVRFQAYNNMTPTTSNAIPTTATPAAYAGGTVVVAGQSAKDNRVTVEDVEDDDDADNNDESAAAPTRIASRSPIDALVDILPPIADVLIEPMVYIEPTRSTGSAATGIQLRKSRGDNQVNSLASMHTRILGGKTSLQGNNFSEVGENFQDAAFEKKLNAELVKTRQWHDRNFALVISWQRAIKTYGEPAARSIKSELQQMIDKGVWHPLSFKDMTKKQRLSAIRAKMFVTEKFFPNGIFDKIKSRLVARGDMQDRSLYSDNDTSAPTAELSSVLSVAAIAACESRYVATCDIGGAFLNADMFKGSGRKVIVKLDKHVTQMLTKLKPDYESFVGDDGYLFVELDKAMYGCIESAKLWFDHLRNILVNDLGFSQNVFDQCTFNKTDDSGFQVTIIMHVDDMLITCANKHTLDGVLTALALKFPETKCHYGPCVPFLGMDMDFKVPGDVRITMQGAEADILATAGQIGDRDTRSPALENLFVVNADSVPVSQPDQDWFRSNVAKLLYLGKRSRPEILTATSFLATRAAKADEDDLGKLRRVLRYIRDSPNRGIRLSPGAHGVHVRAYVDAAYGVHMDGKSHTGVSIVLGESGPIFVRSTKQPIVAKSSTESELIATSDSANQIFHVRNFIIAQGHGDQPATIFQDNLSCMALIEKGKSTSMRSRHIQIRYFWVKERVDNGEAVITHMRSEAMGPANALTKPLVGSQFLEERRQLTNWED